MRGGGDWQNMQVGPVQLLDPADSLTLQDHDDSIYSAPSEVPTLNSSLFRKVWLVCKDYSKYSPICVASTANKIPARDYYVEHTYRASLGHGRLPGRITNILAESTNKDQIRSMSGRRVAAGDRRAREHPSLGFPLRQCSKYRSEAPTAMYVKAQASQARISDTTGRSSEPGSNPLMGTSSDAAIGRGRTTRIRRLQRLIATTARAPHGGELATRGIPKVPGEVAHEPGLEPSPSHDTPRRRRGNDPSAPFTPTYSSS